MPAGFYRLTDARIKHSALVAACPSLFHPSGDATGALERGYYLATDPRMGLSCGFSQLLFSLRFQRLALQPSGQIAKLAENQKRFGQFRFFHIFHTARLSHHNR